MSAPTYEELQRQLADALRREQVLKARDLLAQQREHELMLEIQTLRGELAEFEGMVEELADKMTLISEIKALIKARDDRLRELEERLAQGNGRGT